MTDENMSTTPTATTRIGLVVAVVILCAGISIGYVLYAKKRALRAASAPMPSDQLTSIDDLLARPSTPPRPTVETRAGHWPSNLPVSQSTQLSTQSQSVNPSAEADSAPPTTNSLVFLNRFPGQDNGRVAVVNAAHPAKRALLDLRCDRVYMAAGRGICLQSTKLTGSTYSLTIVFNHDFRETARYGLAGLPSRARISPDGKWAAYTTFVRGHSYTEAGEFSTDSRLIHLRTGRHTSIELFNVTRDGQPFHQVDFNYWGITFAKDSNRFYATLGTGNEVYIVEGDIRQQSMRVIAERGECPSLSPDNRTLVFKERQNRGLNPMHFQLVRYDLVTGQRTALGEPRSVDDQVAWLDSETIAYALRMPHANPAVQLWRLNIAAGSKPQLYVEGAESPSVVTLTTQKKRLMTAAPRVVSTGAD